MISDPKCRYNPTDFDEVLDDVEAISPSVRTVVDDGAELEPIDLNALTIPAWLKTVITFGEDVNAAKPYPSRSEALFDAVQGLLRAGVDDQTIMSLALDTRYAISKKPLERGRKWMASEIARVKAKLNGYHPRQSDITSKSADSQETRSLSAPDVEHFTDLGNARRLVQLFGVDLRYCYDWRQWLVWDTTRWRPDRNGEIVRRAKRTVQTLYTEAAALEDKDARKAAVRWALASESDARIQAMMSLAASEIGIPIIPEDLDANAWLLNCSNGTVNLRTGDLHPHRREDLITKRCPVTYDRDAACPQWIQFLQQVFLGKPELIAFVRSAIGYSLTGDVRERVLFIPYGKGRNGKSTLLELIAEMLGDYSLRTPTETLMVKPYNQIPNDLAQLPGRRFVHASESEEGKRLSESLIKDLTGRDTISARFMRGEFFQFQPVCKLWLRTNHKPVIRGTDNAIWDRIRLIPFDLRISEEQEDCGLPGRLREELPGILAWAVGGCLSWQAHGLGLPTEVKIASATYRAEMDQLAAFLSECSR